MGASTVIDVAAALATIMAAVVTYLGIQLQTRNARLSSSVDLIQKLRQEFDGEQMRARRKNAGRWLLIEQGRLSPGATRLLSHGVERAPEASFTDLTAVMAFFERVGLLIELGALDKTLVWTEFGVFIIFYGDAITELSREKSNDIPDLSPWTHMWSLYERTREIARSEAERTRRPYSPLSTQAVWAYIEREARL